MINRVVLRRRFRLAAIVIIVMASGCDQSPFDEEQVAPFDPVIIDVDPLRTVGKSAKAGDNIPGQYIIVFHEGVGNAGSLASALVGSHGGELLYTYEYAIKGFSARLPEQAVQALDNNPNVSAIVADGVVQKTVSGSQSNPPSWGLDRVDQRDQPLDDVYGYEDDGTGVWAYILDTGINFDHVEFGAPGGSPRAFLGFDGVGDGQNGWDCDGHGTHVSGTVGGSTYGVAKNVNLIAVRVLDCSGSGAWSTVIAGVDYVTNQKQDVLPGDPAVANMSLGGGYYGPANTAVQNSVAAGVTYAVSAGNENADACGKSPASAVDVITVASTTTSDQRSSFSNYGTCTDIFAPGSSIESAYYTSSTATATMSGTSMASPHVAGVAAIYLSANPQASPATVTNAITSIATAGAVGGAGTGSPNLLLYSLVVGGSPPPPPPPPGAVDIHVDVISSINVTGKNRKKGNVVVTVRDDVGAVVPNITVVGLWTVDGVPEQDSGVTDGSGQASLSSSNHVGSPLFEFCVTALSGSGYNDVTDYNADVCSPFDNGGGGTPPSGSPEQLTVQDASRGVNQKASLDWSGGEASVIIYRWDENSVAIGPVGPLNNGGSYTDNLGKTSHASLWYQVCNNGQSPDGSECTARVEVVF